jgi:biopolymer transport protein ExbB
MTEVITTYALNLLPWGVLLCAVCAGAVFVERVFVLGRKRIDPPLLFSRLKTILRQGSPSEILSFCGEKKSPVLFGLRRFALRWREGGRLSRIHLERAGADVRWQLERRLTFLATLAGVAPMLGVLAMLAFLRADGASPVAMGSFSVTPFDTAVAGIVTGVLAHLGYNIFAVRARAFVRDYEHVAWDLYLVLETLTAAHPPAGGTTDVAAAEEDEYFRKKSQSPPQ